jgi:hypothetical protein
MMTWGAPGPHLTTRGPFEADVGYIGWPAHSREPTGEGQPDDEAILRAAAVAALLDILMEVNCVAVLKERRG